MPLTWRPARVADCAAGRLVLCRIGRRGPWDVFLAGACVAGGYTAAEAQAKAEDAIRVREAAATGECAAKGG